RAPRWGSGKRASEVWVLLCLKLRWQIVGQHVGERHVVGDLGAPADGPFAVARWVKRKSNPRRPIILVRLWLAENEAFRTVCVNAFRAIRDCVKQLCV